MVPGPVSRYPLPMPPTPPDAISYAARTVAGVAPFDPLNGEDRTAGQVFEHRGWNRMSDRRRVAFLRDLAERYGRDPRMRWHTARVLAQSGVPPRAFERQCGALLRYVQHAAYYTNEPDEQIQSPWRTLAEKSGDCDDMALLLACMAESIAMPWRFALAGKRAGRPCRWVEGDRWPHGMRASHIYVVMGWPPFAPKQWASAEPTIRGLPLGHDVVRDGVPGGSQGVDLAGRRMGSIGAIGDDPWAWRSWFDPGRIIPSVLEGVATAVAVAWVMRRLEKGGRNK